MNEKLIKTLYFLIVIVAARLMQSSPGWIIKKPVFLSVNWDVNKSDLMTWEQWCTDGGEGLTPAWKMFCNNLYSKIEILFFSYQLLPSMKQSCVRHCIGIKLSYRLNDQESAVVLFTLDTSSWCLIHTKASN